MNTSIAVLLEHKGSTVFSVSPNITIAELFQLSTDRLMGAEFADLLAKELADRERYLEVEERIRRARSGLTAV